MKINSQKQPSNLLDLPNDILMLILNQIDFRDQKAFSQISIAANDFYKANYTKTGYSKALHFDFWQKKEVEKLKAGISKFKQENQFTPFHIPGATRSMNIARVMSNLLTYSAALLMNLVFINFYQTDRIKFSTLIPILTLYNSLILCVAYLSYKELQRDQREHSNSLPSLEMIDKCTAIFNESNEFFFGAAVHQAVHWGINQEVALPNTSVFDMIENIENNIREIETTANKVSHFISRYRCSPVRDVPFADIEDRTVRRYAEHTYFLFNRLQPVTNTSGRYELMDNNLKKRQ